MTVTTGLDRALNGDAGPQRPNQILGNPYGDKSSLTNYLNPQAFAQPALGTFGNMGTFNIHRSFDVPIRYGPVESVQSPRGTEH